MTLLAFPSLTANAPGSRSSILGFTRISALDLIGYLGLQLKQVLDVSVEKFFAISTLIVRWS